MTHWRASHMPPIQSEPSEDRKDLDRSIAIISAILAAIGVAGITYAAFAANT